MRNQRTGKQDRKKEQNSPKNGEDERKRLYCLCSRTTPHSKSHRTGGAVDIGGRRHLYGLGGYTRPHEQKPSVGWTTTRNGREANVRGPSSPIQSVRHGCDIQEEYIGQAERRTSADRHRLYSLCKPCARRDCRGTDAQGPSSLIRPVQLYDAQEARVRDRSSRR